MAGPFVISAKFTLDGAGVTSTAGEIRGQFQSIQSAVNGAAVSMQRLADQRQRLAAQSAASINSSLGVRDDFGSAGRAEDIAAYGRALDAMRAQYNPLFAAEQRHEANLAGIQRAHQLGAISAREMATAVRSEQQAYAQAVASIDSNTDALQRNRAVRSGSGSGGQFATANVAAQFQDIAVTSAMGMSPLQIALQQGTQISGAFGNMGAAGAVKTLAGAFMALVSPVSLVTIALVGGAAAAIQYFAGLGSQAKSADDRLDEHLERITQIARGYDDVAKAASQANEDGRRRPEGAVASDLLAAQRAAVLELRSALTGVADEEARISASLGDLAYAGDVATLSAIEGLDQLGLSAGSTTRELEQVITRLTVMANDEGLSERARKYATDLLPVIENLVAARTELSSVNAAVRALPREIQIKLTVGTEFGNALSDIQSLYMDPRSSFDVARERLENNYAQAQATAQSYGQIVGAGEQYERVLNSINAAEEESKAKASARSAATVSAFDREIQTIQERTAAQQVETNVIGLGTFATERARMVLELENAAREDSIGLSSTRVAQIQEEATAYALAAAAQEKAVEAQRAATEQIEFGRSTFRSFFSDLRAGLQDGQDGWAALGNAGANALDRIADRALGMAADGIFDLIFGAVMGGITGGFGGMGSGLGGISSITGSSGGFFPGFADGGWTGGLAGQARGVVHGEEFVVRAGPAAQNRKLLEAINSGSEVSVGGSGGVSLSPSYNFNGSGFTEAQARRLMQDNNRELMDRLPGALAEARYRAVSGV